MRILYHHRTLGDGAEGIHIAEMVGAFRSLGHEVEVVAPIGDKTNTANAKVSAFSRIKWFVPKILYEFLEIGYNVYGYYLLRKEILKDRPDFIYDRYITFNASSVLIGKRYNIPVFLEVNAPLALERSEQEDERLFLKKTAFFLEKWICSNSYRTIVVSTPLRDYLLSSGVLKRKIIVMPNGVNVRKFAPIGKDKRLLEQYGFSEDNVIVGFVGILRPWHGLDILLEAFQVAEKDNKILRLLIVGDGPIRSDIEEKIGGLALVDKVFITGRVPHDEIPNNVALFDIAVSPKATFYASPMKILEYMALSRAVVAPDTANIRDIIDDKKNGLLFEDGNYLALAGSINDLAENPTTMKQLGESARTKTVEQRNWENNVRSVIKLMTEYMTEFRG